MCNAVGGGGGGGGGRVGAILRDMFSTVQYGTVRYSTAQHSTVQHTFDQFSVYCPAMCGRNPVTLFCVFDYHFTE